MAAVACEGAQDGYGKPLVDADGALLDAQALSSRSASSLARTPFTLTEVETYKRDMATLARTRDYRTRSLATLVQKLVSMAKTRSPQVLVVDDCAADVRREVHTQCQRLQLKYESSDHDDKKQLRVSLKAEPDSLHRVPTKKEFVSQRGQDHVRMTEAEEQACHSRIMSDIRLRNFSPGNKETRESFHRLGVGSKMPETPGHNPCKPSNFFRGSVGKIAWTSDEWAAHEEHLKDIEEQGPPWLRQREKLEEIRSQTKGCMKKWDSDGPSNHHSLSRREGFPNKISGPQTRLTKVL